MKMYFINSKKIITLCCLLLNIQLIADTELAVLYTGSNPDYKPFDSGYGYTISGQYDFENGLFLSGFYDATDFKASGPEVGSVNVEDWLQTGIGFQFENGYGHFYSLITYDSISAINHSYDGFGAHFGYLFNLTEKLEGTVQVGYINTGFDDIQLEGRLNYHLTDSFLITLRLRDYDVWDMTSYGGGFIYRF